MKNAIQTVLCLSLSMFGLFLSCQSPSRFTLGGPEQTSIWLAPQEPAYLQKAVQDLADDLEKITGRSVSQVQRLADCTGNCIVIGSTQNETIAALLPKDKLARLQSTWETYALWTVSNKKLLIAGGGPRATMFGIYHFLEHQLGVDPLYFWTGYEPEKQERIVLKNIRYLSPEPDFKFRGWFINDEDLLTEWKDGGGIRRIDYPYYQQVVAPEVMEEVVEAAVRLRCNLIIPASFIDIRNPAEEKLVAAASQRGLFVSMHHIEPMGVSAFGYQNYWKEKGETPLFSFFSEPKKLEQTWRDYAQRWAKYPDVIWQIGLRGIGDRPMWLADPGVPQSDADRGRIISEAMALQKKIIAEVTGLQNPLMTTTLWAEGSVLNQQGYLSIPEGAMIIFADNSPGWTWQQDFFQTQRKEAWTYGVYYHHQLWGSGPHLVQGVPPAKTYRLFEQARQHNSAEFAIMNVSNLREFPLGIAASMDMLWEMDGFPADQYIRNWCARRFPEAPAQTAQAYQAFFDSYQLVGERQLPGFLDGQQRSRGQQILRQLKEQLQDPAAFQARQKNQQPETKDAFWRSISDMHPADNLPLEELLPPLRRQLAGLGQAQTLAEQARTRLQNEHRAFFEANLLAQIQILTGLGQWLEAAILARQSADAGDLEAVKKQIIQAKAAFDRIRNGQQLAIQGKWQDWYRGDKKMNLRQVEELTLQLLAGLENKK